MLLQTFDLVNVGSDIPAESELYNNKKNETLSRTWTVSRWVELRRGGNQASGNDR